jgi:hypothetical protein
MQLLRSTSSFPWAHLRGLAESIASGFRAVACGIPGSRVRGTGGTLICGLGIPWDRGHPPVDSTEEDFGPARLIEHFLNSEACVDSLIAEVQRFGRGSDRSDDATAVLIRSR